ncbi:MAG: thioredoxin family protein [bacterium]
MAAEVVQTLSTQDIESKVLQAAGPVVLDFHNANCRPCGVFEPRLLRVAMEYRGRVPAYRVDVDRDPVVARRFNVLSLPTVLVIMDGKEVDRLDGVITEPELRNAFERAAGEAEKRPSSS